MIYRRNKMRLLHLCALVFGIYAYAGVEFSRKEYLIPMNVDSDMVVPINAVFSCYSCETNITFYKITQNDPECIQLAKRVHGAIRSGDTIALKNMAIHDPRVGEKIEEDMGVLEKLQIGGYQKYSNQQISVRAIVDVLGSYFIYCLAKNEEGESQSYVYVMRRDEQGRWVWNPLESFYFGDIQAALFAKFSGMKGFSVSPKEPFLCQTFLVGDVEDDNYVSCKYNLVTLTEGIPVADDMYMGLLGQLHSYWQAILTGNVQELSEHFGNKSYQTMLKENEKVQYVGANGLLSETINETFRMTHIVSADPLVFVFYATNQDALSGAVFIKEGEKIKRIRYHSYGGVRNFFEGLVSSQSGKKIELWVH